MIFDLVKDFDDVLDEAMRRDVHSIDWRLYLPQLSGATEQQL